MRKLTSLFCDHPATVGENYFQHMAHSLSYAGRLFLGALACVVHAIFPFLCVKTGSNTIRTLNGRMIANRNSSLDEGETGQMYI